MPHFSWRGVTITGTIKRGVLFAASIHHVDELLLRRGIACISCSKKKRQLLVRRITYRDQVTLLKQLATLLRAGILVPDALGLVAEYVVHPGLQEYVYQSAERLKSGQSLGQALNPTSPFNSLVMQLLHIGNESGDLIQTIEIAADYIDTQRLFYAQLRAALLMPLITCIFVIGLIWAMFAFLLPSIASIFSSFNNQLPYTTEILLRISDIVRNPYVGISFSIIILIGGVIIWLVKRSMIIIDSFLLKMPYIGTIMRERLIVLSLRSLSSLLRSGMRLHAALEILSESVVHNVLKKDLIHIAHEVISGASLSDACASAHGGIFLPDIISMIRIGEESNAVSDMLEVCASSYHERLCRRLTKIATLMQPCLIIVLGLVIALLVMAVYAPIMQLADLI